MRLGNFVYIVTGNLLERKSRTATAVLVVAFAAAVMTAVASVGAGFLSGIVQKAEESLPEDVVVVKPKTMDVSILSFSAGGLTPDAAKQIQALPGVESVSPQIGLKMPLRASGSVMGQSAETDAVVVGIGPEIVKSDVWPEFSFDDPPDTSEEDNHATSPIPCVVPRFFLDMYNFAYAESVGLPKINESFVKGKEFTLHLGETYLLGGLGAKEGKKRELTMRIVGLTSNPGLMAGIMIPLSRAESLNRWYHGKTSTKYTAAHIKVGDPARHNAIVKSLRDMNLTVESQREKLDQIRFVAKAAAVVVAGFVIIILAIAGISILNTFALIMSERRGEIGLLRAVGGTRAVVTGFYAAEAAVIGLAGGLLGTGLSIAILRVLDRKVTATLPDISYLPDRLFSVSWPMAIACVLGPVLVCLLAALPVITRTTGIKTARIVGEA